MSDLQSEPSEDSLHKELREKLKSKMETTTFFSGFFTVFVALTSKQLGTGFKSIDLATQIASWVAVLSALASLILAFGALSAFDSLLMPQRLWSDQSAARDTCHLRDEMMKVWRLLYRPSICALFISILALFYIVSNCPRLVVTGAILALISLGWVVIVTRKQGVF